jgi:hypothetical protein
MREPFLFLCKKLSEFRFRRKANEIRNRRIGRNYASFGAYSPYPHSKHRWRDPARRGPPPLLSCSNRLTQSR